MLEVIINGKSYEYNGNPSVSVITLLEEIGVEYSCSCLQGLCGACAMVINGVPKLACKTFVNEEIYTAEYNKITIDPLSKFPLIKDLKVDRSRLFDDLKECNIYLKSDAETGDVGFEYEMSQCLMCGCCVEACPNYCGDEFKGTPLAVLSSKITLQEKDLNHLKEMQKNYKNHFFKHCVKSLACEDICPMNIKTQRAISLMNKTAVWRIRNLIKR